MRVAPVGATPLPPSRLTQETRPFSGNLDGFAERLKNNSVQLIKHPTSPSSLLIYDSHRDEEIGLTLSADQIENLKNILSNQLYIPPQIIHDASELKRIFRGLKKLIVTNESIGAFGKFIVNAYDALLETNSTNINIDHLQSEIIRECNNNHDFKKAVKLEILTLYPGSLLEGKYDMYSLYLRLPNKGIVDYVSSKIESSFYIRPLCSLALTLSIFLGLGLALSFILIHRLKNNACPTPAPTPLP